MATKAQIEALEAQIRELKWELEKKDDKHQEEMDELVRQHKEEIEELKNDMTPMTRKDVIDLIKSKLSINIHGGYNGYIEGELYFDGRLIDSCSDHVSCDGDPMDE